MAEDTEKRDREPNQMFSPRAVKFGCIRECSCGLCLNSQDVAQAFAIWASFESQDMYSIFLAAGFTFDRSWLWTWTHSLMKSSFVISGKVCAVYEELDTEEAIQTITARMTCMVPLLAAGPRIQSLSVLIECRLSPCWSLDEPRVVFARQMLCLWAPSSEHWFCFSYGQLYKAQPTSAWEVREQNMTSQNSHTGFLHIWLAAWFFFFSSLFFLFSLPFNGSIWGMKLVTYGSQVTLVNVSSSQHNAEKSSWCFLS